MQKLKTIYIVQGCVRPSVNKVIEIGTKAALVCRSDVQQSVE